MDVADLTEDERVALYAALAHMAAADGRISDGEHHEIGELAEEMGVPDLRDRLMQAHSDHPTIEALSELVATVKRRDAREMINTLMFDLAHADGERGDKENDVLDAVTRAWARG